MNSIAKLLSTDGYITVNKTLIHNLGLHEAILIGELCAEYNYWDSLGKLENGSFFSTRQNIEENTGLNEHFQRKAFETLKEYGIVTITKKGLPAKNYYKIDFTQLYTALSTSATQDEELDVNEIQINNNKDNKNKQTDNNVSKDTLTEFEFGKPKKKKSNLYQQCAAMIYGFTDIPALQRLLFTYLDMRLEIKDKPLYANQFKGMLNKLAGYTESATELCEIVQQSIDRGYLSFFPVNNYKQGKSTHDAIHESGSGVVVNDTKEDAEKREQFRAQMEAEGKKAVF